MGHYPREPTAGRGQRRGTRQTGLRARSEPISRLAPPAPYVSDSPCRVDGSATFLGEAPTWRYR